jgi:hypothetical protein
MSRASLLLLLVAFLAGIPGATASSSRPGADYGVYCVKGRLVIDQRDIEELKNQYRADVCRLDQHPCAWEAAETVRRLGGVGAACNCE